MSVIYLTGVLDDGVTVYNPAVPANPRASLELTQDCSTTVRLTVTNRAGVPVVGGSQTLRLTIKKRPQDIPAIASIAGVWETASGPGIATFAITPTTLHGQEWGRYCYDVVLVNGSTRNLVIPTSPLQLLPAVSANP